MPSKIIIKSTIAIILLFFLFQFYPFLTTLSIGELAKKSSSSNLITTVKAANIPVKSPNTLAVANDPIILEGKNYNLDLSGNSDTSVSFQKIINSFPLGSKLKLPKGKYKFINTIKLKDGISIIASSDVIIVGTGENTLFSTGNDNSFEGLEFQNCSTALNVFGKKGLNIINCKFTNNINYAAINFYGANFCKVKNSYFYDIHKYGILIDNDSSSITIDKNTFDNAKVFDGYKEGQISGHVYCLNGSNISVTNNTIKNSGGQGVIFGYNKTTGKGTTSSLASNNICSGNGQEGVTIYGGDTKVTEGNSIIGNTSKNNRNNQIEVWQTNNNTVKNNIVEETIEGRGNMAAICLFATNNTSCTGNKVLYAKNNGIDILAGSLNCIVSGNFVSNTNMQINIDTPESGNAILLDSNGLAAPSNIIISSNTISSSNVIIYKSGIYSTSAINHHNTVSNNKITGYQYGVHIYAQKTCGK